MKKKLMIFMAALLMLTSIGVNLRTVVVMAVSNGKNKTFVMDQPPFDYYKSDDAVSKKNHPIKLKMKSSKANKITDDEKWFSKNNISMKTYEKPGSLSNLSGSLPDGIDTVWKDLIITNAFYDSSYIYCTYGADYSEGYILNIYDAKTLKMVYSLDFSKYRYSPKYLKADYNYIQQKINWSEIKDNILYISHSHNTYAKSSNNMNAYVTAIDLTDMSILWRTKALVSNSYNFLIIDGVIFCGYGFTNEPDFLYQIDRNTGRTLSKTRLKSAASYIIKKGNALYIRTYNNDYIYEIVK